MGEVTTGIRRILEFPIVYNLFQSAVSKKPLWPDLIQAYFPSGRSDFKVLDIGCGPGNFLAGGYLAFDHSNFVGIDPSAQYIEQARREFPAARFHEGTVQDVHLDSDEFDVVVISGVLHHVDDPEAKAILSFAVAHLAPTGFVVSVDPVVFPGQNPIARWMALADRGQNVRTMDELHALWGSCEGFAKNKFDLKHGYLRVPYNHGVCVGYKTHRVENPLA